MEIGAYKAKPLSRLQIRDIVSRMKKKIGLKEIAYIDVIKVLEEFLQTLYSEFSYEYVDDCELPDALAVTMPNDNKIVITKSVRDGALQGNGRDRFTIMHEIGHLVLHRGARVIFVANQENIMPYEELEWQADAFAGEFLMDYDITKDMSVEEIVENCGVSLAAAKFQHRQYQMVKNDR